jgi:hypothetical protein
VHRIFRPQAVENGNRIVLEVRGMEIGLEGFCERGHGRDLGCFAAKPQGVGRI